MACLSAISVNRLPLGDRMSEKTPIKFLHFDTSDVSLPSSFTPLPLLLKVAMSFR